MEFNGFTRRYRWAIALATAVATIVVLVMVYRGTAPTSRGKTATGDPVPGSDVLQVGALPVT
jgi:hypothetical protein